MNTRTLPALALVFLAACNAEEPTPAGPSPERIRADRALSALNSGGRSIEETTRLCADAYDFAPKAGLPIPEHVRRTCVDLHLAAAADALKAKKVEEAEQALARAEAAGAYPERVAPIREKLQAERKRLADAAVASLRKEVDEVEGVTRWYDKSTPKYVNKNAFYVYFTQSAGRLSRLRLVFQYTGAPLEISEYIIRTDQRKWDMIGVTQRPPQRVDVARDPADYWEVYEGLMNDDDLAMVQSIIASKTPVTLRLVGRGGSVDRKLTDKEREGLKHVLDAYVAKGGKLPYDQRARA